MMKGSSSYRLRTLPTSTSVCGKYFKQALGLLHLISSVKCTTQLLLTDAPLTWQPQSPAWQGCAPKDHNHFQRKFSPEELMQRHLQSLTHTQFKYTHTYTHMSDAKDGEAESGIPRLPSTCWFFRIDHHFERPHPFLFLRLNVWSWTHLPALLCWHIYERWQPWKGKCPKRGSRNAQRDFSLETQSPGTLWQTCPDPKAFTEADFQLVLSQEHCAMCVILQWVFTHLFTLCCLWEAGQNSTAEFSIS